MIQTQGNHTRRNAPHPHTPQASLRNAPRCMRRYQSTISGSFQVVEIIETFVSYMESLERCVW